LRDALLAAMPPEHLEFLRGLPLYFQAGDIIFVHAGVRPGIPLVAQSSDDLLWIRDEFLDAWHPEDQLIVHGHTPSADVRIGPGRLGIDTGAFATGVLTAVHFHGTDRHFLQVSRRPSPHA
jgi:serine/threonine protein phosphatase 1